MTTATKRIARTRRPTLRRKPDPPDRARADFMAWWASVAGFLDHLLQTCERIEEDRQREGSPFRLLFDKYAMRDLQQHLADLTCQWASSTPILTPDLPDPLAALLGKGV
jgi:hypothetical protein